MKKSVMPYIVCRVYLANLLAVRTNKPRWEREVTVVNSVRALRDLVAPRVRSSYPIALFSPKKDY